MKTDLWKNSITDVREKEGTLAIYLYFRSEHVPFYLQVYKPNRKEPFYEPINVIHESDMTCPFCDKKYIRHNICSALSKETIDLFEFLTSRNHIRLNWLFREILTKEASDVS